MKNPSVEKTKKPKGKRRHIWSDIKRDRQLHTMILIPIIYLLIFEYWPMYGAQIAFRQYKPRAGITGSQWVGLKWFKKFLTSYKFKDILVNTISVSMYQIIVSLATSVLFALLINAHHNERYKKFTQTITYMPHFISAVVMVGIFNQLFSPVCGLYGSIYRALGNDGYPSDFRNLASTFRHIYVWTGVWQNLGWNTIIFTAALSAVPGELHEAAMLDGASRWKRILHVDFPTILPTVCTMLILKSGSVLTLGFEKAFLLQNTLNLSKSEIISTYVYKVGMGTGADFSFGAAVGLFNSVCNCLMLIFVNWLVKKLSTNEVGIF